MKISPPPSDKYPYIQNQPIEYLNPPYKSNPDAIKYNEKLYDDAN